MPDPQSIILPKPKNWNEFEEICLASSKLRWRTQSFNRFGRQGQKQDGVDIYGYDTLGNLIGIQCKNTIGTLTQSLIDKEITNAESFTPPISELHIATSAPPDANLQRHIMSLSKQRVANGKFGVGILFWSDIEQDLSRDINEVERFYPQFFKSQKPNTTNTEINYRDRDISRLKELLKYIDIEATSLYLDMAPKNIGMKFLEHTEPFQRVIYSPIFAIYDKELDGKLFRWLDKWSEVASRVRCAPYTYIGNRDELSFITPMDYFRTPEEEKIYNDIEEACQDFFKLQSEFCRFIHEKYPEIDLKESSLIARKFYSQL